MQLSRNFTLAEFAPPRDVSRYRLDELRSLCREFLQPLRDEFGPVTISSGFRSRLRNSQVGGAPQSYHLWLPGRAGVAADVTCRRGRPLDWHAFLDGLGAPGLGLYATHVHVDNRRGWARW